uniref:At1g61320/AtMIF1 LRR domain-containing protein n=1 Tax=Hordeum vulgare subsp. vulgare TaxID=112509 RepID=A0A8I6YJC4_HORVV
MSYPSSAPHMNSGSTGEGATGAGESRETQRRRNYRGMGLMALKRLMSMKREQMRKHGRTQSHDGLVSSLARRNCKPSVDLKTSQASEKDDHSHCGKRPSYLGPDLPEEICHHIHSLVPMRDDARAACVSRAFHHSWRCHLNLTFTKETMCSKKSLFEGTEDSNDRRNRREYNNNIDHILANHRGVGVKTFILEFHGPYNTKSYNRLNSWLQIAITPVMEELTLILLSEKAKYEFPCSLLSERSGNTIRHLHLDNCVLRPTVALNLRCLTELYLYQRLSYMELLDCLRLKVIENKAPNISSFQFAGNEVQLSLGKSLQVKSLKLHHRCAISHAIDKLPSIVPNLERLNIISPHEMVNAPMVPSKFLHLKTLSITIHWWWSLNREYDFLSLVSFLDASPSLETFVLSVSVEKKYDLFVGDPSTLRQMPEHRHDKLKSVRITGFCPQKSLVELTRHILESSMSIKYLILDTIRVNSRCSGNISRKCSSLDKEYIKEACRSIMAIKTYVKGIVPCTTWLNILGPCSRCHAL